MAPLKIDPDEVEQFASKLSEFSSFIQSATGRMDARFSDLRRSWDDPVYLRFDRDFRELMPVLTRFVRQAEGELVPHLWATCRRAREYEESGGGN